MDERTLLAYDKNGEPLTEEHGFPLRIYITNHYGMKQHKWINSIEAVAEERTGYWVERGWSKRAVVNTTSVIDTLEIDPPDSTTGSVPIGGIAYAGARGIGKVEVQVDGGDWMEAQLRAPSLSPLAWVQWRYDWQASPGRHMLRVRATDGDGALQEAQFRDVRPDGATGIHSREFQI